MAIGMIEAILPVYILVKYKYVMAMGIVEAILNLKKFCSYCLL